MTWRSSLTWRWSLTATRRPRSVAVAVNDQVNDLENVAPARGGGEGGVYEPHVRISLREIPPREERFENPRPDLLRDARARVGNHQHEIGAAAAGPDLDASLAGDRVNRIGDEVGERLVEERRIA